MCGITGFIAPAASAGCRVAEIQRMADRLARRGPDDAGTWCDPQAGIALGHRRLSVLDLSPQGHQPMVSHCGRYVIVLNGEIYNHLDLRQRLDPIDWRGHSDTETLLACFSRWGVRDTLPLTVGMFAFAVWDREERRLTLARDRMGEKPLYWGTLPSGEFVFASELKALRAHPNWAGEVDRDALALFLRHDYVPAPRSIYRGIGKLQPGRWLSVAADGRREEGEYWSLPGAARSGEEGRGQPLSDAAAVERLEALLGDAGRQQLLSDVPLGAFLSGGVDSSTVVALMTRHATARVRTFTIGFDEAGFNEAEHAKAVARHLGTEHTELYVSAADALSVIPQLPAIYDEPFADASQVPTFLVARMARERVTVALSGDGGDELFL
ncbi:MAG: asparagine synthase (glutamine-hydrolyzing), partial [Burkholderiales bacterium]|nr:asparagine synthase (glutamine-hydrolyzing) [Burkholderiales bacterium]